VATPNSSSPVFAIEFISIMRGAPRSHRMALLRLCPVDPMRLSPRPPAFPPGLSPSSAEKSLSAFLLSCDGESPPRRSRSYAVLSVPACRLPASQSGTILRLARSGSGTFTFAFVNMLINCRAFTTSRGNPIRSTSCNAGRSPKQGPHHVAQNVEQVPFPWRALVADLSIAINCRQVKIRRWFARRDLVLRVKHKDLVSGERRQQDGSGLSCLAIVCNRHLRLQKLFQS
jgi:hypothetical protein